MSIDGTDFRVAEHGPAWSSHKYNMKSGVRYEVGLCIATGDIVWINGPYNCGRWPDISIFRNSLLSHLAPNERVEADDGYIGEAPRYVKCPKSIANVPEKEYMQQRVRNRQESVNNRFKFWGILKQVYKQHRISSHADVFRAVAVITQLAINSGEKLFTVYYDDNPPWLDNDEDAAATAEDEDDDDY